MLRAWRAGGEIGVGFRGENELGVAGMLRG